MHDDSSYLSFHVGDCVGLLSVVVGVGYRAGHAAAAATSGALLPTDALSTLTAAVS